MLVEDILRNNYFTILCLLAGESLGPVTMSGRDLHLRYAQLFDIHYNSLKNTERYRSLFLLPYAEDDYDWPDFFKIHVENSRNAALVKAQKSGHTDVALNMNQNINFGKTIEKTFKDTKLEINNHINSNWIEPSLWPSGMSKSSFLFYLRRCYYESTYFSRLAREAVYGKHLRLQMKTKVSDGGQEQPEEQSQDQDDSQVKKKWKYEDHLDEIELKKSEYNFRDGKELYPSFWLAFVYLGLPSDQPLSCLISGLANKKNKISKAEHVHSIEKLRKNLCKPNRRLINQSPGSVDESSPVTSPVSKKVEHVITIQLSEPTQLQRQKQHSKEVDTTLEQLKASGENELYLDLLRAKAASLKRGYASLDQEINSATDLTNEFNNSS